MQEAAESTPGGSGMVALVGADEKQANDLCTLAKGSSSSGVMVPANYNCPGQIVISGSQTSCDLALGIATQMGLRATPLKVAGAFHSPLMAPAAQRLSDALNEVTWSTPKVPVLSNVTAMPHDSQDIASIKKRLVEQLTSPVRWTASMLWLVKNVPGRYVELAPGKVLSGLMRRIDRNTKITNFDGPTA
jgi:[acyl-carrier-protein] S-malonyltransferase